MTSRYLPLLVLAFAVGCRKPVPLETSVPVFGSDVAPKSVLTPTQEIARNFERVNFEYDSANLTTDAKSALDDNARILTENPGVTVQVQGHCDDRGTTSYNLSLGEQRAATVQRYLGACGVSATRIATISYGEERPLQSGEGEYAWAQNRRAEFLVTGGNTGLVMGTIR